MKSRRVSIAISVSVVLAFCQLAAAEPDASVRAESESPASTPSESAPALEKTIETTVRASKALDVLDYYRPVAATEVRFLVIVDRVSPRDSQKRVAPDLLASRDGKLWLLDQRVVRPLKRGDLARHRYSLLEAQQGLKSATKRPVSIVMPRRLVSKR